MHQGYTFRLYAILTGVYPISYPFCILWLSSLSWLSPIRSPLRMHRMSACTCIRADAANKLEMPGAPFTTPRVQAISAVLRLRGAGLEDRGNRSDCEQKVTESQRVKHASGRAARCAAAGPSRLGGSERRNTHSVNNLVSVAAAARARGGTFFSKRSPEIPAPVRSAGDACLRRVPVFCSRQPDRTPRVRGGGSQEDILHSRGLRCLSTIG